MALTLGSSTIQAAEALPLLTTVERIRNLTEEAAQRQYPVRVEGIVLFVDPSSGITLQDATEGIWINTAGPPNNLKVGQRLRVEGVTGRGGFLPIIEQARCTVLGQGDLPTPVPLPMFEPVSRKITSSWVVASGIVRAVYPDPSRRYPWAVFLDLQTPAARRQVRLVYETNRPLPTYLVDANVRVFGVAGSRWNDKRQAGEYHLSVPSMQYIAVERPAASDPFSIPRQSAISFFQSSHENLTGHQARVQGTVTCFLPGQGLYIRDESGGFFAQTRETKPLNIGDKVDVIGFPELGDYSPIFLDASYRRIGSGPAPQPVPLTITSPLAGNRDAELISLKARLLNSFSSSNRLVLTLESNHTVFVAELLTSQTNMLPRPPENGSVLQLTGIYVLKARRDMNITARELQLMLRSPDDIVVVEKPSWSWWTVQRVLGVVAILTLFFLVALGWLAFLAKKNADLKQQVHERQQAEHALAQERAQLRSLIDNLPDHIYFKDRQSRFIVVNAAMGRNVGKCSPADMVGKTDFDFHAPEFARKFFADEQALMESGHALNQDESWTDRDGRRRWEHITKAPITNERDQVIGLVGISRDISERVESEEKLESIHKQLMDSSRQAAMVEVANGILHNVNNVLNSVNVSVNVLVENVKGSKIFNVAKVAGLLRDHAPDLGEFITRDEKGKQVPAFLEKLASHLENEQTQNLKELHSLTQNVAHVKEVVAMQQNYAKMGGNTEILAIQDLVEDALRMNAAAFVRHDIKLVREYEAVPPFTVDKHRILQIMANLLRNAKHACDEGRSTDKLIRIRIAKNGDNRVCIQVADNGVGIVPENLERIFTYGFTTRKQGHGFGLHSSSNAVREMGGSLTVHSDGPDQGATFTLELPLSPAAAPHVPSGLNNSLGVT